MIRTRALCLKMIALGLSLSVVAQGQEGKVARQSKALDGNWKELASAEILKGRCWTVPVLASGLLYARKAPGDLVCVDPRGKK